MSSPYRESAAGANIDRWVECCWSMYNDEPVHGYSVRPDGCMDLLFSLSDGLRVVGAMTSRMRFDLPARSRSVGIRFRPGMAGAFFAMPAGELTDKSVDAEEFLGSRAKEAESRLMAARSAEESMRIMTAVIGAPRPLTGVQRAIEAITSNRGRIDLGRIAAQANLSRRQFRRRCLEESGLAPKQLCRILRFRGAMQLASCQTKPNWTGVALESGYFDQAHMIRDFREFGGGSPMAVFSKTA